jgi:hypothetical protein
MPEAHESPHVLSLGNIYEVLEILTQDDRGHVVDQLAGNALCTDLIVRSPAPTPISALSGIGMLRR